MIKDILKFYNNMVSTNLISYDKKQISIIIEIDKIARYKALNYIKESQ